MQKEIDTKMMSAPNQNASLLEHYQKVRKHQYETNYKLGHDRSMVSLSKSQVDLQEHIDIKRDTLQKHAENLYNGRT